MKLQYIILFCLCSFLYVLPFFQAFLFQSCEEYTLRCFAVQWELLISMQVHGLMEDTYVRLIKFRFHLFRSSASSFSSQYLLLFLKSSKAVFFFLLLSPPSYILQWQHEGRSFFSEYDQSNWLFYVRGYYLEVSSSLLYVQELGFTQSHQNSSVNKIVK